jgi:hypothetical protein
MSATKHSKAKANPARNAKALFLTDLHILPIISVPNSNMLVIY